MSAGGLTKLMEECGELIQICAKKAAFMAVDDHPDDKGSMKIRLENEIADVKAAMTFVMMKFKLDDNRIERRHLEKATAFVKWDRGEG